MQNKILLFLLLCPVVLLGQYNKSYIQDKYKLNEINQLALKDSIVDNGKIFIAQNKHNPAISLLLSLVIPGAGHYYSDRMDVGKYFLGTEATLWLGLFGVNYYGNVLKDDARSYALFHSGFNSNGKDDDFYSNIGNYLNVYDYNNKQLQKGEYSSLYNPATHFWSWDSPGNMDDYNVQRKRSERTLNVRTLFITGMIINRVVSGISALVLTNKGNKAGFNVTSELTSRPEKGFDGIKINFTKSF